MYNGTPLARNNQRGVVTNVELEVVLVLKSFEVLYVNRDKNNRIGYNSARVAMQFYELSCQVQLI